VIIVLTTSSLFQARRKTEANLEEVDVKIKKKNENGM